MRIEADKDTDRVDAVCDHLTNKKRETCSRALIVKGSQRIPSGTDALLPQPRIPAVEIGFAMGAKEWQKLERITCNVPFIADDLWMAGTNNMPVSGGHMMCSLHKSAVPRQNIRLLAKWSKRACQPWGVAQAAASYDGGLHQRADTRMLPLHALPQCLCTGVSPLFCNPRAGGETVTASLSHEDDSCELPDDLVRGVKGVGLLSAEAIQEMLRLQLLPRAGGSLRQIHHRMSDNEWTPPIEPESVEVRQTYRAERCG